jgi:hypothetical protein
MSVFNRYVSTQVISRLRRSIGILQGWQTRDTHYFTLVTATRAENNRVLAALRAWQTRETELLEREDELRTELTGVLVHISELESLIQTETARLERKRTIVTRSKLTISVNNPEWGDTTPAPGTYLYLRNTPVTVTAEANQGYRLDFWELDGKKVVPHPGEEISVVMDRDHTLRAIFIEIVKQLVHAKIIVYSIVRGRPDKKYMKRFQAFYNVDAIRDTATGEIDYTAPLTEREIDACIDYFYALWNWTSLPARATEPVWIESGQYDTIDTPQGADLKQISVREDEEETYSRRFTPPETVYVPTSQEAEEMMKLVRKE